MGETHSEMHLGEVASSLYAIAGGARFARVGYFRTPIDFFLKGAIVSPGKWHVDQ